MDSRIKTIHHELVSGKRSCLDIVQEKLALLSANTYHSVNLLLADEALAQAKNVDGKIKSGKPIGLLEGVPFGIQDVILLQNTLTTGSSDFLKQYHSPYTATAIQKLMDVGVIPIVKEHCDSFGHGDTSGGAVHVAKGYTAFSIGVDTGGSIRKPAGYHQLYGLKPTYGRVSRFGLMANMSSTDCIGPLASSLEDIRLLLNTISGKDQNDQTTYPSAMIPENVFDTGYIGKEIVVGYYPSFIENDNVDEVIKNDFQKMLDTLSAKGIKIKPLDFFDLNILVSVFYVLEMAETASSLARLDGSLYGARSKSVSKEGYMKTRAEHFTEETKRRIVGGNLAVSRGSFDEIYLKVRSLRNIIIDRFDSNFKEVDIILSPVTTNCRDAACHVSTIDHNTDYPVAEYLSDAFTVGFSLGGLPTLTVPFFTPTGIQITANKNQEDRILYFAHALKEML